VAVADCRHPLDERLLAQDPGGADGGVIRELEVLAECAVLIGAQGRGQEGAILPCELFAPIPADRDDGLIVLTYGLVSRCGGERLRVAD
jgi:hypothetical protein